MSRMSNREFVEWFIYHDKIDPFGELRADMRAGLVASPIVNLLRKSVYKNPEDTKPSEWIIDLLKPIKSTSEMAWQEMKQVCIQLAELGKKGFFGDSKPTKKR